MTDEDTATLRLLHQALLELVRKNPAWGKNREVFINWPPERQLFWWNQVQKQAALGVPAMQELVSAVILLRLTS